MVKPLTRERIVEAADTLFYEQLGRQHDADQLAMHLLAFSQGIATMANTFKVKAFISNEVERFETWLESIEHNIDTKEAH